MLIEKTIGQVLQQTAQANPDSEAVCDAERRLTYRELDQLVDLCARALLARGVYKGTHVGIWARETVQTLVCFYALWRIGAVVVPLCTVYTSQELLLCLDAADVSVLLVGTGHKENCFTDMEAQLPKHIHIIPIATFAFLQTLCRDAERVSCEALREAACCVTPEDCDTILFTSGSTGTAKPVITTHLSRVNILAEQAKALETKKQDRFCSVLPMYHCFSITATVLAAMYAGACVCFPADTHTRTILKLIEAQRCTILTAVPTLFSALLYRLEQEAFDVSSLRTGMIGGSTYTTEFFIRLCQHFSMTLLPSLGLSEATAGITTGSLYDPISVRAATIGKFFSCIEGSIRDPKTKEELPTGQTGEICVRGVGVMKGYYLQPEATHAVIDPDGWLHTGDLGWVDASGYVTYAGRIKELIIRGGENISPVEIERILLGDSRIRQVKVIGVPDDHYTEEICACVTASTPLTDNAVREIVRQQAAYYKVPKYVMFWDEFPMTCTGKINLKELKKQAVRSLKLY